MLSGETGADNNFSVTVTNVSDNSTVSDLLFQQLCRLHRILNLQLMDLRLKDQVIPLMMLSQVLTFNLNEVTSSAVTIDLSRDTTAVKENITGLVNAYNEFIDVIKSCSES